MPKNKLETYYLIAFSLLGIFPIVPLIVKPFLLAPLVLTSLLGLCMAEKNRIDWKKIIVSTSIYFLFVLSAIHTTDADGAIKLLIRLTPFLILPLSFAVVPKPLYKKLTDTFIQVYMISCFLFCFIIFIYAKTLNSSDVYYIYSYLSDKFWGYEDHPIYISLYFGIALILILFKKEKSIYNIILFTTIFFTLLFLSRKGNIIGLGVVLLFMLFSNSKKLLTKGFFRYFIVGLFIVLGASYLFNNFLFTRFKEIVNLSQFINNPETSTGIRGVVWRIVFNLSLDAPYFGYGLGGTQNLIDSSLIENGYKELTTIHRYNAHNQYLQIVLTSGYLGLLFFLSILSYVFLKIKNNKRAFCIFLYIIICFIFESLLERQNGIIISALFFNIFLFLPPNKDIINE